MFEFFFFHQFSLGFLQLVAGQGQFGVFASQIPDDGFVCGAEAFADPAHDVEGQPGMGLGCRFKPGAAQFEDAGVSLGPYRCGAPVFFHDQAEFAHKLSRGKHCKEAVVCGPEGLDNLKTAFKHHKHAVAGLILITEDPARGQVNGPGGGGKGGKVRIAKGAEQGDGIKVHRRSPSFFMRL